VSTHGSADIFDPVITGLTTDAAAHFGVGPVRLFPQERQERPFSHLLRLGVCRAGEDTPISHLFVKILKPVSVEGGIDALRRRVADDFATTRRVYAAMAGYAQLGVVPPVACYPEHLAIVTEQVTGATLLEYLMRYAAWFPAASRVEQLAETMANVGQWVRVFQSIDAGGGTVTIASLRDYVDHRLRKLVAHARSRFGEGERQAVLRHIDVLGRQVDPRELSEVPIHADLAPGNILISGTRIVVLDFAMAKRGTRLQDLTRLCVQIDLLGVKPQMTGRVLRQLQRALVRGFDASLTPAAPLFRLMTLLHRINHLTTLSVNRYGGATGIYNSLVRRRHRRWLAAEIEGRGALAAHA
jgi:aminoglycoside phosphotransferase (APT) family kinase protein